MAVSTQAIVTTYADVTVPGTSVAPQVDPPDNCHTIVVKNTSGANTVKWKQAAAGGNLNTDDSASTVPAGLSDTMPIGTKRDRGDMSDALNTGVVYDADVAMKVEIAYYCRFSAW